MDNGNDGRLLFVEQVFLTNLVVFVKETFFTIDEFNVAYKLREKALFISYSIPVSGNKLYEFIIENMFVEDDIIQSY